MIIDLKLLIRKHYFRFYVDKVTSKYNFIDNLYELNITVRWLLFLRAALYAKQMNSESES